MALAQSHYRFGVDELAESTHGWHAAENTAPTAGALGLDTTFLLRFNVQASGGVAHSNIDFQFQCQLNGGTWTNITTTSSVVRAVAAAAFTNGAACTKRLLGTGTFESSGAGCTEDGLAGGTANDIVANGCSETECGLQILSADVANNDVIAFRLTSPDATLTYTVTPSYTVVVSLPAIAGDLSVTLDSASVSSDTTLALRAETSQALAGATLAATATVVGESLSASLSSTLDALTGAGAASLPLRSSLSQTLASLTASAQATIPLRSTASPSLAPATASSAGTLALRAAVIPTLSPATSTAAATLALRAALSGTLAPATAAGQGGAVEDRVGQAACQLGELVLLATGGGVGQGETCAECVSALTPSSIMAGRMWRARRRR